MIAQITTTESACRCCKSDCSSRLTHSIVYLSSVRCRWRRISAVLLRFSLSLSLCVCACLRVTLQVLEVIPINQGLKKPFFVSQRMSCYGRRTTCSVREDKVWILYLLTALVIGSSPSLLWEMMLWLSVLVSCIRYSKRCKFRPRMHLAARLCPDLLEELEHSPRPRSRNWGCAYF